MITSTDSPRPEHGSSLLGPVLTLGFGHAVAMWVTAFITHLPWLDLPPRFAGPAVVAVWAIAAIVSSARLPVPSGRRVLIMTISGLVSAALGLGILGSQLTQPASDGMPAPGTTGLVPGAGLVVAGFLALGLVIGSGAGLIGGALSRVPGVEPPPRTWLARLATVTAISVVPLLIVGGAVTSTKSGMAIIGWPDSYGANMFLYPISLMAHPGPFFEHTHRLFGTLVGLATIALTIYTFIASRSVFLRVFAASLLVLVIVQGVLGGARVDLISARYGLIHGVLAQVFFALVVAFAAYVRPLYSSGRGLPGVRSRVPILATLLLPAAIVQLILGAMYRHLGSQHSLYTHAAFSMIVMVLALLAGFSLRKLATDAPENTRPAAARRPLKKLGMGLVHAVVLQFLLGWGAFWAVLTYDDRQIPVGQEVHTAEQVPIAQAVIRTVHQANGAFVLALATLAFVWGRWASEAPEKRPD